MQTSMWGKKIDKKARAVLLKKLADRRERERGKREGKERKERITEGMEVGSGSDGSGEGKRGKAGWEGRNRKGIKRKGNASSTTEEEEDPALALSRSDRARSVDIGAAMREHLEEIEGVRLKSKNLQGGQSREMKLAVAALKDMTMALATRAEAHGEAPDWLLKRNRELVEDAKRKDQTIAKLQREVESLRKDLRILVAKMGTLTAVMGKETRGRKAIEEEEKKRKVKEDEDRRRREEDKRREDVEERERWRKELEREREGKRREAAERKRMDVDSEGSAGLSPGLGKWSKGPPSPLREGLAGLDRTIAELQHRRTLLARQGKEVAGGRKGKSQRSVDPCGQFMSPQTTCTPVTPRAAPTSPEKKKRRKGRRRRDG